MGDHERHGLSPAIWVVLGVIFTTNAVLMTAFDAPRPLILLNAITGLLAVLTAFVHLRPAAGRARRARR